MSYLQDAGSEAEDLAYARMQMRVRTFSSCYAHTLSLNLEAQTSFVFPQRSRYSGFHPSRSDLTCSVVRLWLLVALSRATVGRIAMLCMASWRHCLSLLVWFILISRVIAYLVAEVTGCLSRLVAPQPAVKLHQ